MVLLLPSFVGGPPLPLPCTAPPDVAAGGEHGPMNSALLIILTVKQGFHVKSGPPYLYLKL